MGFRRHGSKEVPESAHEEVLSALRSGLSPAAAATVAGVSATTGYTWARAAGWRAGGGHTGIRYSAAVREAFWAAMRSGSSTAQAAQIAGVSEMSASIWVKQAGYVPRTQRPAVFEIVSCRRRRAPLTFVERCRLEDLLEGGCTAVRAAELLDRHRDTIRREIAKGLTGSGYRARVGQDTADENRKRPKERRLQSRPALLAEVLTGLEARHSPEQIAGRLRQDFPDDPEMWVSHETIYQALYVQPRGELARLVKTALRTGRSQRKPQGRKETGQGKLKDMINISDRPAEADDRAIPGHWESQWCCQAA
jgi:IS30 family transposase